MTVSYSPTSEPRASLIRCSSSWMIRSGGRRRSTAVGWVAGRPATAGCRVRHQAKSGFFQPWRGQRSSTSPNRVAVAAFHGSWASLSTVPMTSAGVSR